MKQRKWKMWATAFPTGRLSCVFYESREEALWGNRVPPGMKQYGKLIPVEVRELPKPKRRKG